MNKIIKKINLKVIRSCCQASVDYTDFNKQNDQLLSQNEKEQIEKLESQLDIHQKRRIEQLAQAFTQLDIIEFQGLNKLMIQDQQAPQSIQIPIRRQCELNEISQDTHPEPNYEWFNNQPVLKELFKGGLDEFAQVFNTIGSGGGSSVQTQTTSESNKEEVKEEVKEQTNFDVELTAIDASQKIKIIKEVRSLCGLGLKEAKEAVEKLPNVLAKQATKQDADKIVEQLKKMGCTIILK